MKHVLFIILCGGCLTASGLAADPVRTLDTREMDRIAAGATCLALGCTTGGLGGPLAGLPPVAAPLGGGFVLPGIGFAYSTCRGNTCSASTSVSSSGASGSPF